MFNCVTGFLGDNVLMYASDYPRSECHFPHSVDYVLGWSSLKPEMQHKLLWDNAARFYKQTCKGGTLLDSANAVFQDE